MMRIGLVSDTHGFLDPLVLDYFDDCDEIWHAGDFGHVAVADQLAGLRPLRGVYGNIDDGAIRGRFPQWLDWNAEGLRISMVHIGGAPERYARGVARRLRNQPADILVCGHSHIIRAVRDPRLGDMLYINPGAAGREGPHIMRTAMILELADGAVTRLQVLELGPRVGVTGSGSNG